MPETNKGKFGDLVNLDRMVALSDGVVAVAITLMALQIAVPEGITAKQLPDALRGLTTSFLSYSLSFLLVAFYWLQHNGIFKYIRRNDTSLIWLNLSFLFLIVLVPFATDLIDRFGDEKMPALIYAGLMMLVGLVVSVTWRYATKGHRLVDEDLPESTIRWGNSLRLVWPAVFLLSMPVILINTTIGRYMWIFQVPLMFWLYTLSRKREAEG